MTLKHLTQFNDTNEWKKIDIKKAAEAEESETYYCNICGRTSLTCNISSYKTVTGKIKTYCICIHCNHILTEV